MHKPWSSKRSRGIQLVLSELGLGLGLPPLSSLALLVRRLVAQHPVDDELGVHVVVLVGPDLPEERRHRVVHAVLHRGGPVENRTHRPRQQAQKVLGRAVGRANDHRVHVAALQHAERALEHVHDRIVQALVGVDALVVVEPHHHRRARVARLFPHHAQRVNVARVEQVEAAVHVENGGGEAGRDRGRRRHHALERALGRDPEHARARVQAGGVGGVVAETLQRRGLGKERVLRELRVRCRRREVVRLAHQEHAAHQVCGGDVGGALDHHKQAQGLDALVAVVAVGVGGDVVAVHHVLAPVPAHELRVCDVRRVGHGVRGPLARLHVGHAFVEAHDHGALVVEDLLVGVDADVELFAQLAGLEHGAGVAFALVGGAGGGVAEKRTVVGEVEAAVDPDAAVFDSGRSVVHGGGPARGWRLGGAVHVCALALRTTHY